MKQKLIKEYKRLLNLCVDINKNTKHCADIMTGKTNGKQTFSIYVYENSNIECQQVISQVEDITLPNINKCRQKLLKYKEW